MATCVALNFAVPHLDASRRCHCPRGTRLFAIQLFFEAAEDGIADLPLRREARALLLIGDTLEPVQRWRPSTAGGGAATEGLPSERFSRERLAALQMC